MNRTTLGDVKDGGQKLPVGNSKLKNRVQPSKNGKNPAPNNNPTPSTTLSKRQVPPTTKQKSQPLKRNPESQLNTNNSNKKDLNKNSTKGKPQVLPAKPANTNNTPKGGAASGNPAASTTNNPKANIGFKLQPKSASPKSTSGTKSTTNANATPKGGAASGNPAASTTNNPKANIGSKLQPKSASPKPTSGEKNATNADATPKKGPASGNPAAPQTNNSKANIGSKPQQPTPKKTTSGEKNATNTNATPKKSTASGNPAAPQTNDPKTEAESNSQSIGGTKSLTLEQPKAPNGQPSIEQTNQTENATKLIQTNQIKLIKDSLDKVLNNWKLCDAALRLAYGDDYYSKLNKDYDKLRQDRLELKVEKYKCSLADSAKTAIPLPAGESPKALNSQEQIKALLKKNKTELMKIEDSRYNISTIAFFTELAPQIVGAARSDTLDATFIKGICEQIQQMVQKTSPRIYLDSLDLLRIRDTVHENFPERSLESLQREQIEQLLQGYPQMSLESLDMLQIAFRRLLDPQVLQAVRDHINDYLQQIRDAQGDEALQTRIEERLQAFVYNFLVPPYQEPNEGSCFATAFLMNMWYNSPIDYMRFIRWAVDTDEPFDLTKIGGRGIIDLRALRKGDPRIVIKRVLLAIIAPMYESAFKNERTQELRRQTNKITDEMLNSKTDKTLDSQNEVARALINACITINPGTSYVDGEWLPTFLLKTYAEKTSDVFNREISIIKDAAPDISPSDAQKIATRIFTEVRRRGGGRSKGIIQNWGKGQRFEEKTITFEKPIENGTFTEEQFKSLSDALKGGGKGKFAIIALYYQDKEGNPDGGHGCNIVIDDSYETMQLGESRKFINLNYLDKIHSSSWISIEKTANGYQIKKNGAPFNETIYKIGVYPTFEAKIMRHPV